MKEARQRLLEIFGNNIRFNRDFERYFLRLKQGMAEELIEWCIRCRDNMEIGSVPAKKEFKNLYVFFRKIASDVRAVLIKEQNGDFIEIILSGHKCYDKTRQKLGYKKSSYYGS